MWRFLFAFAQVALAANGKFISVAGRCDKRVAPDRAQVELNSVVHDATPSAASSRAIKLYEKVRAEVKKLNLKNLELQTNQFNVNPEYDYVNGRQKLKGYEAQMSLLVETSELQRMGEVIELAAKQGVQNVGQLSSFLSPELMRTEQEACLDEAIKNARAKAERMAKAAGTKLGDVFSMDENHPADVATGNLAPGLPMAGAMMNKSAGDERAAPTLETKTQTISVSVGVVYSL